jgi:hypothetical protein
MRRNIIGLRQVRRLLRCAPSKGTYLSFVATPCIHPHLTQRVVRIDQTFPRTGLEPNAVASLPRHLPGCYRGPYSPMRQRNFNAWLVFNSAGAG